LVGTEKDAKTSFNLVLPTISGFTGDESKTICQQLEAAGLDLIELSGGTYESMAGGFGSNPKSVSD
jgi:2,4-dienoyl-CoA reductase-like NADH-dependent reductase (Old Yellow Enzyme family)